MIGHYSSQMRSNDGKNKSNSHENREEAVYQNIRDTNEITFPSLIGVDREKKGLE